MHIYPSPQDNFNETSCPENLRPLLAIVSGSCSSFCTRAVDVCEFMSSMIIFGSSLFVISSFSGVS